jgi:hypothetical protein
MHYSECGLDLACHEYGRRTDRVSRLRDAHKQVPVPELDRIAFVPEIRKTSVGKINKRVLRERHA